MGRRRFFNLRTDWWGEHFRLGLDGIIIVPSTEIGEATIRIFRINDGERLLERATLREISRYPTVVAERRIRESA